MYLRAERTSTSVGFERSIPLGLFRYYRLADYSYASIDGSGLCVSPLWCAAQWYLTESGALLRILHMDIHSTGDSNNMTDFQPVFCCVKPRGWGIAGHMRRILLLQVLVFMA